MKLTVKAGLKGGKRKTVSAITAPAFTIDADGVCKPLDGETLPSEGTWLAFPATRSVLKMVASYGRLCVGNANRKGYAVAPSYDTIHALAAACRYDQGRSIADPFEKAAKASVEATKGRGSWEALTDEARNTMTALMRQVLSVDPADALKALVADVEAEDTEEAEDTSE